MPLGLKRQLHTTIRRVQCLRDIRDQVGRVLDANRQPDRRVENPYAGWQAGKRLGAAEAHSELEYLQRVEKFESSGLGAYDVERAWSPRRCIASRTEGRRACSRRGEQGIGPWPPWRGRAGN